MRSVFQIACCLLYVSSCDGKKVREFFGLPFIRSLILSGRCHSRDLIDHQRPCFLLPSYWELGFQCINIGEGAHTFNSLQGSLVWGARLKYEIIFSTARTQQMLLRTTLVLFLACWGKLFYLGGIMLVMDSEISLQTQWTVGYPWLLESPTLGYWDRILSSLADVVKFHLYTMRCVAQGVLCIQMQRPEARQSLI